MAWVKVPPEHRPVFEAALPRDPRVRTMQMFGGIAASVHGNMFGGLFGRSAIVKLYGADHAEALAIPGASMFDPMGNGRVAKDIVMLPEDAFHDEEQLEGWLRRAFDGAVRLPPKAAKSPKPRSTKVARTAKPPATPTRAKAPATGKAKARATGKAKVRATGKAKVRATGKSKVRATGKSTARAKARPRRP